MGFLRKILVLILFVILSSVTIHADSTHDKLSAELYTKSGIEKLTEQIAPLVLSSFDQNITRDPNTANLPKSTLSQIRAGIPESFSETFIKNEILAYIKTRLPEKEIRTVLKWLDSPLGKTFTKLEEEASTPEAVQAMQAYSETLQKNPPPQERINLALKMDSLIKSTETTVEMIMNSQLAIASAITMAQPREMQKSISDIKEELKRIRPQLERELKNQILISFLYTYRSISDADIKTYIAFSKTDTGKKYNSTTLTAVKNTLIICSVNWGKSIAEALNTKNIMQDI